MKTPEELARSKGLQIGATDLQYFLSLPYPERVRELQRLGEEVFLSGYKTGYEAGRGDAYGPRDSRGE